MVEYYIGAKMTQLKLPTLIWINLIKYIKRERQLQNMSSSL